MDIIEVSEAVVARAAPALPDWNTFWFEPSPIPLPAACVTPDPRMFADYQQVTGSYTRWYLRLGLFVAANDEEAARRTMAALTDPDGELRGALMPHDEPPDDGLVTVAVTVGKGWSVVRRNKARYLYSELGLEVGAN